MVFGWCTPVLCPLGNPAMYKLILRWVRWIVTAVLILFACVFFAVRHPAVQTWLVHGIGDRLSSDLGTRVHVEQVEIDLWARLVLRGVFIADHHEDTLLYAKAIRIRNYGFSPSTGNISLRHVELQSPYFRLMRYEGEDHLNTAFLSDYFNSGSSGDTTASFRISLKDLRIRDGRFDYYNENRGFRKGFDWNHLALAGIHLDLEHLVAQGDSMHAILADLSMTEKGGFDLRRFRAALTVVPGEIRMENASIATARSNLNGNLTFRLRSVEDLDFFEERVGMEHDLQESVVELGDIGYFTESLYGISKTITLSGRFRGTVSNLRGREIYLKFDRNSWFRGSFHMDGLPEIGQTFIDCSVRELVTNYRELSAIPIPPFSEPHFLDVPENLNTLGTMRFNGSFTGFINDFVAFGRLNTDIGSVRSDISLSEDSLLRDYVYSGTFGADQFDLGAFTGDRTLGHVTTELRVDGSGLSLNTMDARLDGTIRSMEINGYSLVNVVADGTMKRQFFDGFCQIDDPHLIADFLGQVDFRGKEPELKFSSSIMHMDLRALGILPDFPYSAISGQVDINSTGIDPDRFAGTISVRDLVYCSADRDYAISRLDIKAERGLESRITLDSDIAAGFVHGQFNAADLVPSLEQILADVVPSYNPDIRAHRTQSFSLQLDILDFSYFSEIFVPQLTISPGTRVSLSVDELTSSLRLVVYSDSIRYQDVKFSGVVLDARRPDASVYASLVADEILAGDGLRFPQFALDARTNADSVYTDIVWGGSGSPHQGDIKGRLSVTSARRMDFLFYPGMLRVNDDNWSIREGGMVAYSSDSIAIRAFEIRNGMQKMEVDGLLSRNPKDELSVDLTAFNLELLNPFLGDEIRLKGLLTGNSSVRDPYGTVISSNDLYLAGFEINDYAIGDVRVESTWDNLLRRLALEGDIEKEKIRSLRFSGYYSPSDEESPLDLQATVADFDLSFISAFLDPEVLGVKGFATGEIEVAGTFAEPQLSGKAALRDAWIMVPYLNCSYQIMDKIGIYPDMFTFDYVRIRDQEGNGGRLIGTLIHHAFGEWSYDMVIDLENSFLAMNTTEELNSLYYGKAYCSGVVNIFGYDDKIELDVNARTEKGTRLAMPMNSSEEQSFASFIRFVNDDTVPEEEDIDLTGIKMNFELDITPDAEFQIIFDEAVGDVMKGRGKGHINMEINNLSTFNMYGTVELVSGNYLFTLKNLLNKEFTVRPGGTISWFGDPFAADLNLEAIYKVSASLHDLIPDDLNQTGQRVPVDLVMKLTGRMLTPGINFDVRLPTVDELTRSRVASAINTDQERNRQAFSLLVLRRFVTPPNITTDRGSNTALAENSTELLSSQISNWLSQISDDFNLGFNYRPGDEISSTEIALALNTQMFNERLSISGNFGVRQGNETNQNPTNYIGDIRVEYKIAQDGKIRLVVYNESNDFRTAATQQVPYTQGVGVLYQEEFDNWEQFVCGFRQLFVSADNKQPCF
jgi:hypothetical protein